MGSYNSQYKNYYQSLTNNHRKININKISNHSSVLLKRIKVDLIGVLTLCFVVIICKAIALPHTQAVYNYSKNSVNEEFNYKNTINAIKNLDLIEVRDKGIFYMEKVLKKINIQPQKSQESDEKI